MMKTLEGTLKARMHRHQVGTQMFCPACNGILDARRAVTLDLYRDGKLVWTKANCLSCWTQAAPRVRANVEATANAALEIYNGKTKTTERYEGPKEIDNSSEQTGFDFKKES